VLLLLLAWPGLVPGFAWCLAWPGLATAGHAPAAAVSLRGQAHGWPCRPGARGLATTQHTTTKHNTHPALLQRRAAALFRWWRQHAEERGAKHQRHTARRAHLEAAALRRHLHRWHVGGLSPPPPPPASPQAPTIESIPAASHPPADALTPPPHPTPPHPTPPHPTPPPNSPFWV
jgi:hypothetical protein